MIGWNISQRFTIITLLIFVNNKLVVCFKVTIKLFEI